jgi:hypothetical protein
VAGIVAAVAAIVVAAVTAWVLVSARRTG